MMPREHENEIFNRKADSDLTGSLWYSAALWRWHYHTRHFGLVGSGRAGSCHTLFRTVYHPDHSHHPGGAFSLSKPWNSGNWQGLWPDHPHLVHYTGNTWPLLDPPASNCACCHKSWLWSRIFRSQWLAGLFRARFNFPGGDRW